jgi:hypothetical protein
VAQQATVRRIRRSVFNRAAPERAGASRWVLCQPTSGRCALGRSATTADDSWVGLLVPSPVPLARVAGVGMRETHARA